MTNNKYRRMYIFISVMNFVVLVRNIDAEIKSHSSRKGRREGRRQGSTLLAAEVECRTEGIVRGYSSPSFFPPLKINFRVLFFLFFFFFSGWLAGCETKKKITQPPSIKYRNRTE